MKLKTRNYLVSLMVGFMSTVGMVQSTMAQCPTVDASKIPTTVCMDEVVDLTVITPSGGRWYRYSSYDQPFTTFSQNYSGTATLTYLATDNCPTQVSISVVEKAKFYSTADIPSSMCSGAAAINLTSSVPQGVTVTTYIDGVAASTLDPSTLSAGSHSVKWVGANSGKCMDSLTKTFTISTLPAPTVADRTVAQADGQITLTATGSSPSASFTWWKLNGATYEQTSASFNVSSMKPGEYTFQVAETSNSCSSERATMKLTVKSSCTLAPPTVAQTTIATCAIGDVTLTATGDPGATIIWYDNAALTGSGIAFTLSPTQAGDYYVVQRDNVCTSDATKVSVVVSTPPAAPTTADVTACSGTSYKLSASGTNIEWWDKSSGSTVKVWTGSDYSPTTAGTYYATQTIDNCQSPEAAAKLTVVETPKAAVSADKNQVCAGSSVTLTVSGTGQWVGTIPTTISNTQYSYTATAAQSVTFEYKETVGTCSSSATTTVLFVTAVAPTLSPAKTNLCTQDIIALNPSPLGGEYTSDNTAANLVGDKFSTQTEGTYKITYTVAKGTSCEAQTSVDLSVAATPFARVFADKSEYCVGQTISVQTSNNGSLSAPSGYTADAQGTYSFQVSNSTPSKLQYIAVNGACSDTAETTISIKSPSSISFNFLNSSVCFGKQVGIQFYPQNGTFETTNGAVDKTNNTFTPSQAGTASVTYTVDKGQVCETSVTKTLTVKAKPTASLSVSPTACVGQTVLFGTSGNGAVIEPDVSIEDNNSFSFVAETAGTTNIVYVAIENGCSDTARASVAVGGGTAGTISFNPPATACVGQGLNLSASPEGGVFSSTIGSVSSGVFKSDIAGTATITYTVGKGSSCEAKVEKTVTINASPKASISVSPQSTCVGNTVTYTSSNNGTLLQPATATATGGGIYTEKLLTAGTYNVIYVASENGCTDTARTTVTALQAAGTATLDIPTAICTGTTLSLTGLPTGGSYTTTIGSETNGQFVSNTTGEATITYSVGEGSCASTVTKKLTILEKPSVTFELAASFCVGQTATLAPTPAGGTYTQTNCSVSGSTLSVDNAGLASVTYTVSNAACSTAVTKNFTAVDKTTVNFVLPSSVCAGATLALNASPVGGVYEPTIGTVNGSNFVSENAGTATITYYLGKGTDCESKASASIVVLQTPSITSISPSATQTITAGTASAQFTAVATGGDAISYIWKNSSSAVVARQAIYTISTGTLSAGQYKYTVTAQNGSCVSTAAEAVLLVSAGNLDFTTLDATITRATDSIAAATTGVSVGKYPSSAVSALTKTRDSVQTAKTTASTQDDVTVLTSKLKAAIQLFIASRITTPDADRATLLAKISEATDSSKFAIAGTHVGQYPASAISDITAAIAAAKDVYNNPAASQQAVKSATANLATALETFLSKVVVPVIDRTMLSQAIDSIAPLSTKYADSLGMGDGQYSASNYQTVLSQLSAAQTVLTASGSTQEQIIFAAVALTDAWTAFKATKVVVDRSLLRAKINQADSLLIIARLRTGTSVGNYPTSAVLEYEETYNTITSVYYQKAVTAYQILKAVSDLTAAMTKLNASIITHVAITSVKALFATQYIALGETVSLGYEVLPSNASNKAVMFTVSDQSVVQIVNGKVYAKATGTAVITVTAIDDFSMQTSITVVVSDFTAIDEKLAENALVITGSQLQCNLPKDVRIAVVAVNGQVVKLVEQAPADSLIDLSDLAAGTYVVTIYQKNAIILSKKINKN